jgi:hypothetical protein
MTRPSVNHDGFLVPNAGGLTYPRMAEVDQIDFNTLSQSRWAVVEGCLVTVSGTTATTLGGTVIVNGMLVRLASSETHLGVGSPQDRFDLIVASNDGTIRTRAGTPGFDPVLPDPDVDETTLAAVFVPTGSSSFADYVIDKRVMAPHALLAKRLPDQPLVRNVKDVGGILTDLFLLRGEGDMTWAGDTVLYREDVATLRVNDNINLRKNLQAGGDVTAENLTSRNLVRGTNIFSAVAPAGGEPLGALRQDPVTGRLYVNSATGWVEIATIENTAPVGAVLTTVEPPERMPPGWVQLAGQTINEQDKPTLFGLPKMAQFVSGMAPNRVMEMPDMTNRVLIGTKTTPAYGGNNQITLVQANLPAHVHSVRVLPSGGFSPTGSMTQAGGHTHAQAGISGEHFHPLNDPGHKHNGMEGPFGSGNADVVGLMWGGNNKIDALFNDRNHTYSVEAYQWTAAAATGITIGSVGSGHYHVLEPTGDHVHGLTFNPVPEHVHGVTESPIGTSTPIDIRQASFSVYMYIKA